MEFEFKIKMIKELSKALIDQILEEFPQLQTLNLSNNGNIKAQ